MHEQLTYTDADAFQISPSISDDGTRIALISNADLEGSGRNAEKQPQIFLYDTRSAEFRQVTEGPGIRWDTAMALSKNGNRIAFTSTGDFTGRNSDGTPEVFVFDIPGGYFTQVTASVLPLISEKFSISFDGTRIAYEMRNPGFDYGSTYLADLGSGAATHQLVLIGGGNPSISGDGTRIAMDSTRDLGENSDLNREIFVYDTASHSIEQITHTVSVTNEAPAISHDGGRIAFTWSTPSGSEGISVFNKETNGVTALFDIVKPVQELQISSDGSRVGFRILVTGGGVFVMDVETRAWVATEMIHGLLPPGGSPPDGDTDTEPSYIQKMLTEGIKLFSLSRSGSHVPFISVLSEADPDFQGDANDNMELHWVREPLPPFANNDFVTTLEDTDVAVNVLENDFDPMLGPLSVLTLGSLPQHGLATFHPNGRVMYRPDDNFYGTDVFTYVAENIGGEKATAAVFVTVLPVNDPVLIEAPESGFTNEDEPLVFSAAAGNGITISDVDIGNSTLEVELTVTAGTLRLGDVTGTTGDQKEIVTTLRGSLEAVNGALDGLTLTPDEDYNGPATINIRATDLYAAADDPAGTDTHTLQIAVLPLNDAPITIVPGEQTGFEDVPLPLGAISVFDVDADEGTGQLRVTLWVGNGTLSVDEAVAGGLASGNIRGNGTAAVTLEGTQATINATLTSDGGLMYLGNIDFSGTDTLTVTTDDLGNTGAPGPLSSSHSVAIQILSAQEQLDQLRQSLEEVLSGGDSDTGLRNSIAASLDAADAALERGQRQVASHLLVTLLIRTEALRDAQVLSDSQARALVEPIRTILAGISVAGESEGTLADAVIGEIFSDLEDPLDEYRLGEILTILAGDLETN